MAINNNIQETYCDLTLSKLLKKAGFNVLVCCGYDLRDINHQSYDLPKGLQFGISSNEAEHMVTAPTLALAVDWVYTNFGYYVYATLSSDNAWICAIQNQDGDLVKKFLFFLSKEEALSAGLNFVLVNR